MIGEHMNEFGHSASFWLIWERRGIFFNEDTIILLFI